MLFGIPNTGERAFMCTEHTEEDVEWALEVADNAFAAIGKEARRHKEKAPTVQLQFRARHSKKWRTVATRTGSPDRGYVWTGFTSRGSGAVRLLWNGQASRNVSVISLAGMAFLSSGSTPLRRALGASTIHPPGCVGSRMR